MREGDQGLSTLGRTPVPVRSERILSAVLQLLGSGEEEGRKGTMTHYQARIHRQLPPGVVWTVSQDPETGGRRHTFRKGHAPTISIGVPPAILDRGEEAVYDFVLRELKAALRERRGKGALGESGQ